MKIEREHFLKAGLHERREERIDYANGYTARDLSPQEFETTWMSEKNIRVLAV